MKNLSEAIGKSHSKVYKAQKATKKNSSIEIYGFS